MRVVFLSSEYGSEKSKSAYAHRLNQLRLSLEDCGVETGFVSLREQPISRPILAHPLDMPFLRKKVGNPDFIHAGGNAAYAAAFLKPFTSAAVINDVHGDATSEVHLKWETRRGVRNAFLVAQAWIADTISYRCSDYFLVVSKPLGQMLSGKKSISQGRLSIVRNGVDLSLFHPANDHIREDGRFTVVYAGGFQAWQGLENLLRAFELIDDPRINLKIIGFTGQQAGLKAEIATRLGDRVELIDRVSQEDLVAQLGAATIAIIPRPAHPAVRVALPTKFGEYLALAKPVIVCDVDETAELVKQNDCGLVSEPDHRALAETIRIASRLDRARITAMGCNARCLAERELSWEVIGRKYADCLNEWSQHEP